VNLAEFLAVHWGLSGAAVTPHHGGMNSATWFVGDRWVLKSVPADAGAAFEGGLAVAAHLDRAGIPAGAAVAPGVVRAGGRAWALLTYVPGDEVHDQRAIGGTLAAVHRALAGITVPGQQEFHWVDPAAGHLAVRDWIRPAVAAAVADLDTSRMTSGLLHSDPARDAFRPGGGIIDWSVALHGPLLYDLASAVMYAGGPAAAGDLIASYLADAPMSAAEADAGLAPMLRFRWAVQADYFARRIATGDLTGIADPTGNEKGLADARRALGS
jgi:Ser/Thr protein kinase RdoA (MazF antagonist)